MKSTAQQPMPRAQLLQERIAAAKNRQRSESKIRRNPRGLPFNASAGQQSLYTLWKSDPKSRKYQYLLRCNIDGPLDSERLLAAAKVVLHRHDVLHSVFELTDDALLCRPVADMSLDVRIVDFRDMSEEESHSAVDRETQELNGLGFNLETEAPVRLRLIQKLPDQSTLLMLFHHIAVDERSISVILDQITEGYRDGGQRLPIAESDFQYADVLAHQVQLSRSAEKTSRFWRKHLEGVADAINLPAFFDTQKDTGQAYLTESLPQHLSRQLAEAACCHNVSPFVIQLAAWGLSLHFLSGEKRFTIGTPVSQRSHEEFADVVGFLIDSLPIVFDFSSSQTVSQLIAVTQRNFVDALDHRTSLDQIVAAFGAKRSANNLPLFNVMFVGAGTLDDCSLGTATVLRPETIHSGESKFDLTLFASEPNDDTTTALEFESSGFSTDAAQRILRLWTHVLAGLMESPDAPIASIDLLSEEDKAAHARLNESNAEGPLEAKLTQELIWERAFESPDAPALLGDDVEVSYCDMIARAEKLALHLMECGVRPEDKVGICFDANPDMVIAILAVLKSGAAYVPLDPSQPKERFNSVVTDCEMTLVITNSDLKSHLRFTNLSIITESDLPADDERAVKFPLVHESHPAYVIYTSGSTGKPKGVQVSHDALAKSTMAREAFYDAQPERFLLMSPNWFDSSVAGIFWTLCTGGALVIPSPGCIREIRQLAEFVNRNAVTHALCLPSLYQLLLRHSHRNQIITLRSVIVAGEECTSKTVDDHCRMLPHTALFNEYGPTEASVWATVEDLTKSQSELARLSIGRAAPGSQIQLLTEYGQRTPIGVVGEVHIGGERLAAGYIGDNQLTADKFIDLGGARVYKTGDLAQLRPDGRLIFCGRRDSQVKVNGHRIEIGEVEAALVQMPGVAEVAVGLVPSSNADSLEDLSRRLAKLPDSVQAEMLHAVSRASENRHVVSKPDDQFSVQVSFHERNSIAAPRERQKKWLVDQTIAETISDFHHLDKIAPTFVSGDPTPHAPADLSQRRMSSQEIMEDWQTPLMKAMAEYTCRPDDDVLEIGFGRGVAASFIQDCGVASHTVVEMNPHSISDFYRPWREKLSGRNIRLIEGRWQDSLSQLETYDAVFFHAFPMSEQEFLDYIVNSVTFAEHFFSTAAELLRPNGRFTYMSTEIDSLSRRHQRSLYQHFYEVHMKPQELNVPQDTRDAWWANSMMVVRAIKSERSGT